MSLSMFSDGFIIGFILIIIIAVVSIFDFFYIRMKKKKSNSMYFSLIQEKIQ